jgi:uncharacterized lipoprotein YajG
MKRIPTVSMSLLLLLVAYVLLAACAGTRCNIDDTPMSGVPIILVLGVGYLSIWVVVYKIFGCED